MEEGVNMYEQYKEERRGSGRRGVQTGKARQRRNCSRNNHGCHGYVSEKSRDKSKGRFSERCLFTIDAELSSRAGSYLIFNSTRAVDPIRLQ